MTNNSTDQFFKNPVLGHPAGLFVLFFTEMWERFSYYGMRALLVLFLTSQLAEGGWSWPNENALALYGTYTSMVYLTPILGGFLADKLLGYRWAVILGAFVMTLGHASMAVETPFFLYIGLFCLIIGNGFFKPNMTSIISHIYKDHEDKKDGAYTIFYMGVNAGAFLGIMLCGYIGEKVSWSWGFGLAGIFMFLGMLQFYFSQNIFGSIGLAPSKVIEGEEIIVTEKDSAEALAENTHKEVKEADSGKRNPFTTYDLVLIAISALIGVVWSVNDPMKYIAKINIFNFTVGKLSGDNFIILVALCMFLLLLIMRIVRYEKVIRDRMIAITIFAFFTVFFWASFEQAGGSMTIFAESFTQRVLNGHTATIFKIVDTVLTIAPLGIITWVLYKLFRQTFKNYAIANIILGGSFAIIWGIVLWKVFREFSSSSTEVPATWFGILNSFFIIAFASSFSKWWESKYNPSAAVKYGLGLILLGIGFGALAFGAASIPQGATTASVSMIWLILAYLFHTLGELCLSPVGLSYVSKLVPGRMIGMMFGIWYLAIAIGNKLAGTMGGKIDEITAQYSLSTFFLIFTIVPIIVGLLAAVLNPLLKKLMHGVR